MNELISSPLTNRIRGGLKMAHVFSHPEYGDLHVVIYNGNAYFLLNDIMRGLTLIDVEDTIARVSEKAIIRIPENSDDLYIKYDWLNALFGVIRNRKATNFKWWIWKEVNPQVDILVREFIDEQADSTEVSTYYNDGQNMEVLPMTETNAIQVFEHEQFGKVRSITINNEPWFVAADVCKALEVGDTHRAIDRLDDDEKGRSSIPTPGGRQEMYIVNEPGLYGLVLGSRKKEAKSFKRWITHDVLPSIRKTGGYIKGEEHMTDDELIARALLMVNEKLKLREQEIAGLNHRLEEAAPKINFADTVEAKGECVGLGEFAKMLYNDDTKVGRTRLIGWLREQGFFLQYDPVPYQQFIQQNLFTVKLKQIQTGRIVPVTLITPKGQIKLTDLFKKTYKAA